MNHDCKDKTRRCAVMCVNIYMHGHGKVRRKYIGRDR